VVVRPLLRASTVCVPSWRCSVPHDDGIFISTGGFTSDAEREVRSQENRRITLIDMEKLFDPWVEHYAPIADSDKPLMPIVPVYFLALRE
jgi:restriction system protein